MSTEKSNTPATQGQRSQDGHNRRAARECLLERLSLVALFVDQLMVVASFSAAYWLRFHSGFVAMHGFDRPPTLASYVNLITLGSGFLFFGLLFQNMYQHLELMQPWRILGRLFGVNLICLFAFIGISLVAKTDPPISRLFVFFSFFSIFLFIFSWRLALSWFLHRPVWSQKLHQRVVFIGWNHDIEEAFNRSSGKISPIFEIVGYVTTNHASHDDLIPKAVSLGCVYELETLFECHAIDVAVVADQNAARTELLHIASLCERAHVQFALVPRFFEVMVAGLRANYVAGLPVLSVTDLPLDRFTNRLLKRATDVVGSLVGLVLSLPVIVFFGAWIFFENPGSIFFAQERIGFNGRRFRMFKLRSMKLGAELQDNLNQSTLRQDDRLLRIGKFLRKHNLDETPQFFNVLIGDMSLVGPRPERTFHSQKLSREIPHYNARYSCHPGVTGWAQVNGWRGNTSLDQRIRHDVWYVENWSFWLDAKIMFLTFIRRDNAY